jgi:hypothetical protein
MEEPRREIDTAYRTGAATLSALAGAALGLVMAAILVLGDVERGVSWFVFVGAVAGALAGAIVPVGAMDFVEGTIHFLIGFFGTSARLVVLDNESDDVPRLPTPPVQQPEWLRWAFWYGVLFAFVAWGASAL